MCVLRVHGIFKLDDVLQKDIYHFGAAVPVFKFELKVWY